MVEELWSYGARSALAYVSVGGPEYTFFAGAGSPRTGHDRFRIGSVSETFVAVIDLQLAAEGRLQLDDSLTRYVHGVYGLGNRITLRQLLGDTSGLANYGSFFWWLARANRRNDLQPLDLLKVAQAQPRVFTPPGSSFAYSLTDYIALGLILLGDAAASTGNPTVAASADRSRVAVVVTGGPSPSDRNPDMATLLCR